MINFYVSQSLILELDNYLVYLVIALLKSYMNTFLCNQQNEYKQQKLISYNSWVNLLYSITMKVKDHVVPLLDRTY